MNQDSKSQLLEFIRTFGPQSPADLSILLEISTRAVHKHLKDLLESGEILKMGTPPRVAYKLKESTPQNPLSDLPEEEIDAINSSFFKLLPNGELLSGAPAFYAWLKSTKQEKNYKSLSKAYLTSTRELKDKRNKLNLFDLSQKLQETFNNDLFLNKVMCSDFYSLPQFGKTQLGNLVTAGKSGQDTKSIKTIADLISPQISSLIKSEKIDSLAWVPHSIPRKMMFLPTLKKILKVNLPEWQLIKIFSGGIPVAQKSLSKLEERITNARETILVKSIPENSKTVLLIDDALGSGSTLNEIAHKIKLKSPNTKIIGYAIVGSLKGFDVLGVV